MKRKHYIASVNDLLLPKGSYKQACKLKGRVIGTLLFSIISVLVPITIFLYYITLPFALLNDVIYGVR